MGRKKKQKSLETKFRFRRHDRIGANDALEDREILKACFLDTGDLDVLANTSRPECIVLGRTGVGKTAILSMLKEREEKVIPLSPFDLALHHLANRPMLQSFMEIGIDLDLFFSILWRHIFALELIKLVSSKSGDQGIYNLFQRIQQRIYTKRSHKIAQEYLAQYPEFWKDTQVLIKEEAETLESNVSNRIKGTLGAGIIETLLLGAELSRESNSRLTREERAQIAQLGQQVVDQLQMRQLSSVVELLVNEIERDQQKRYFITIDQLDENWTHNVLRYRLIKALIETIRYFNGKSSQIKIVCAIREDLLDRVFRLTRTQGHQQEKFRSLYLQLFWKEKDLVDLIEVRINQLISHKYTKNRSVGISDILPKMIEQSNTITYIIRRTLRTPRDVIMFFNECIKQADDRAKMNKTHILAAEGVYSELRLKALADEWSADYPTLADAMEMLKRFSKTFRLRDLDKRQVENRFVDYLLRTHKHSENDYIYNVLYEKMDFDDVMPELLRVFYQVGILGIKTEKYLRTYWSFQGDKISSFDVSDDNQVQIHPAFFRVLGIRP